MLAWFWSYSRVSYHFFGYLVGQLLVLILSIQVVLALGLIFSSKILCRVWLELPQEFYFPSAFLISYSTLGLDMVRGWWPTLFTTSVLTGWHYDPGPVEVFIIGAALSTTSLGTCTAMRKGSPNQCANAILQAPPLLLSPRLLVQ